MSSESSTGAVTDVNATTTVDGDPDASPDSSGAKPTANQEAATYRTKLREAEAERDALGGVVAGLRTSIVDGLSETAGINPALLWASGVTVADLLSDAKEGEDGAGLIDTTKVDRAINAAREKFGLPGPAHNPMLGLDGNEPEPTVDFASAFKPPGVHP